MRGTPAFRSMAGRARAGVDLFPRTVLLGRSVLGNAQATRSLLRSDSQRGCHGPVATREERHVRWPVGDLEVLQIGRLLWTANHAARFDRASFGAMAEAYGRAFRAFEENGLLQLPA